MNVPRIMRGACSTCCNPEQPCRFHLGMEMGLAMGEEELEFQRRKRESSMEEQLRWMDCPV